MFLGLNRNIPFEIAFYMLPIAMFYLLAKVSEVNHKLDTMNHDMKESVFILQHKKAIFLAEHSSGRIKINQTLKDGNQHACGSLISFNDIYYFATNLHVVFDYDTNRVRKIEEIVLYDGTILNFSNSIIMFNNIKLPDIALIVVSPNTIQKSHAAVPSNYKNYLGQQIIAISNKEMRPVFEKCNVVEIINKYSIQTNCGGTHGSSGTGYLDDDGYLVAIHRAQARFYDEAYNYQYKKNLTNTYISKNITKLETIKFIKLIIANLGTISKLANIETLLNMTKSEIISNLEKINNLTNITGLASIVDFPIEKLNDDYIYEEISYFPIFINEQNTINSLENFYKGLSIDTINLMGKLLNERKTAEEIFDDQYSEYSKRAYELSNQLRNCLAVEMRTYARNPRAEAVSSKSIFKLLKNKTKQTITLKQGEVYCLYR